ncbi:MAG TPA: gamma-glutamyltransferase [Rhizobiaceae bacterium]|nr:gamma-glutamyltransferase [Rhizobiaceae bacterium]
MRAFDVPGRSPVHAENGMAATSHPLATASALTILKEGGNAVDAAIAAAATLCVVEPQMTGIGGDCFAIVAEPDGTIHGLNGSGRAAKGADAAWYRDNGHAEIPLFSAHAVTVPGALRAWEALARRFGTLSFNRIFQDAIRYGEHGYPVAPRVAFDWARAVDGLMRDPGAERHLLIAGKAPVAGQRHAQPALAATLKRVARDGADAFYTGEIAAEIAATVQGAGGFLVEEDLAGMQADWVKPLSTPYGGHDLLELPPNGQGMVAMIIANILDSVGARECAPDSAARYHLMIEAARLAYAVRDAMLADPAAMTVAAEQLVSKEFAATLASRIDPRRRATDVALPTLPSSDTVYLTVVDRDRRAVSFINSLYDSFGARLVTPKSGVALQNRGACFTLEEGHPNELKPGKRPLHTIIPAMTVQGGRQAISFGVMGGAYQPLGHAHVLSNMLDHGMDPQAAIDHPRLFFDDEGVIRVESGIARKVIRGLREYGHTVEPAERPHGGGQAIVIDWTSGFLIGGSDPRKDGCALGY